MSFFGSVDYNAPAEGAGSKSRVSAAREQNPTQVAMKNLSKEISGLWQGTAYSSSHTSTMPLPFCQDDSGPFAYALKQPAKYLDQSDKSSPNQPTASTSFNHQIAVVVPHDLQLRPAADSTKPVQLPLSPPIQTLVQLAHLARTFPPADQDLIARAGSPASPPSADLITPKLVPSQRVSPTTAPASPLPPLFEEGKDQKNSGPSSSAKAKKSSKPKAGTNTLSREETRESLFDGPLTDSEDESDDYDPRKVTPVRKPANKRTTRASRGGKASSQQASSSNKPAQSQTDLPTPKSQAGSEPSKSKRRLPKPTLLPARGTRSCPIAPDAEANSDYQGSEGGDSVQEDVSQSSFSGGPQRGRGERRNGDGRRGNGGGGHPYKNVKTRPSHVPGKIVCDYSSPYDGWKCEQVLARTYDVPRHMEVHAKEEYELVLKGRLKREHATLFESVTFANVYVCMVCRKEFSRKDAMQRHIRNSSKTSKAKHRAESKVSVKKRPMGSPIHPHPGYVPEEVLQRHRASLEKLKENAQAMGQDVTDWDVEQMMPKVEDMIEEPPEATLPRLEPSHSVFAVELQTPAPSTSLSVKRSPRRIAPKPTAEKPVVNIPDVKMEHERDELESEDAEDGGARSFEDEEDGEGSMDLD